jgi:hypothetical protein
VARVTLLLIAFAALAAWAGAQGPAPSLSPEQRAELFKKNRTLLENLVENGISLSSADSPLNRAEASHATAVTLANYLKRAATEDRDPDRVAELADLMTAVVRDGLLPNAAEADRTIPPQSRAERDRLAKVQGAAAAELEAIRILIPAGGKVGDSEKARAAIEALAGLKDKIKK